MYFLLVELVSQMLGLALGKITLVSLIASDNIRQNMEC